MTGVEGVAILHHPSREPLLFQSLFILIDQNQDGFVDKEDWVYGVLNFHFCSGPESPYSLWFGPIPDEDDVTAEKRGWRCFLCFF